MPFGDAFVGISGVLERAQLQLALEVSVRVRPGIFEIVHQVLGRGVEGHEGPEHLRERPGHRDVVAGAPGGDAGQLRVHGREGEDEAAAARHDPLSVTWDA